jgi:hypothetical protein
MISSLEGEEEVSLNDDTEAGGEEVEQVRDDPVAGDDHSVEEDENGDGAVDIYEDEEESELEDVEGWDFAPRQKIDINMDGTKELLKTVLKERKQVLRQIENELHPSYNEDDITAWLLKPLLEYALIHVNLYRKRRHEALATRKDIVAFLHFEILCCIYNETPSTIFSTANFYSRHASENITRENYFSILRALGLCRDGPNHVPFERDQGIDDLEERVAKVCSHLYVKKTTIISFDDDKLRIKALQAKKHGLVLKMINGQMKPVQHVAASVLTGLFLGSHIEMRGESIEDAFEVVLRRLTRVTLVKHINLGNTLIAIDRGYHGKSTTEFLLRLQSDIIGTRKRDGNFAFTWDKKAKTGQREVPILGASAAYWATKKEKVDTNGDAKSVNVTLHAICWRAHSRATLLQTSDEDYGVSKWHYITSNSGRARSVFVIDDADTSLLDVVGPLDVIAKPAKDSVTRTTIGSGGAEWFVMRRFCITSSILGAPATKWIKGEYKNWVESFDGDERTKRMNDIELAKNVLGINQAAEMEPGSTQEDGTIQELVAKCNLKQLVQLCKDKIDNTKGYGGKTKLELATLLVKKGLTVSDAPSGPVSMGMAQLLHNRWFMRPLDAKHLDIGKTNEETVLQWLPEHLRTHSNLRVLKLEPWGMVSSKVHPHLFTSVDQLATLAIVDAANRLDGMAFMCMIEIKTRSSLKKIKEIKAYLRGRNPHVQLDAETEYAELHKWIPESQYRCQIAQHAVVPDLEDVLYIESTQHDILFTVHVKFSKRVREALVNGVLNPINQLYIDPLHKSLKENREGSILELNNIEPGYAVDEYTYRQHFLLRETLLAHRPLPDADAILPAIVNAWNQLKGKLFSEFTSCISPSKLTLNRKQEELMYTPDLSATYRPDMNA